MSSLISDRKHPTSGPWKVYDQEIDDGPPHGCVIESETDKDMDWIAQEIHNRADARLIAAAPDLLEALDRVLNYWEPECQAEDCNKGWHVDQFHAWQVAKAAVAKARGGKP